MRVSQMTADIALDGLAIRNDQVDELVDTMRVVLEGMRPRPRVTIELKGVGLSFGGVSDEVTLTELLDDAEQQRQSLMFDYWSTSYLDRRRKEPLRLAQRLGVAMASMDERRIQEAMPPKYMILRSDDHGSVFLMVEGLTWKEAHTKLCDYESRGHKQTYTMVPYTDETKQEVMHMHDVQIM